MTMTATISNDERKYDYIICGGGAAGLSLAIRLAVPEFRDKRILLIEKEKKTSNDRTWCFWERPGGQFDSILTMGWDRLRFQSDSLDKILDIKPYRYKMIRSENFYKHCHDLIERQENISLIQAEVSHIEENRVVTPVGVFFADMIFTSIIDQAIDKTQYLYAAQHFGGYFLRADQPYFSVSEATFMDFRLDKNHDCRFGYVLPMDERNALVEIAEFSNNVLNKSEYRELLDGYIAQYHPGLSYTVDEFEYGIIPMTSYPFWERNTDSIIHIGVAGGATKASTGFAFSLIQSQCDKIVHMLLTGSLDHASLAIPWKTQWMDRIFLDVMLYKRTPMSGVFSDIFRSVDAHRLLRFLNNESSVLDDLSVIMASPKWPFTKALWHQLGGAATPDAG